MRSELDEYRLVRPLGQGAMGEVFLGHDTILDRPVAVKFVSAPSPDAIARERFLTEARAIARLQHPNVVTIFRVGEADGRPFLVSEFVRGKSLDRISKPVPSAEALRLGLGLSRGLAAAHRRGVLHRDIKPGNAILADDGEVKLLDFGLAKLLDEGASLTGRAAVSPPVPVPEGTAFDATADLPLQGEGAQAAAAISAITNPGTLLGTPRYMAPELWRGEAATARSDIYALGCLLYELCAGEGPRREATIAALRDAVCDRDAQPLSQRAPGLDPRLCAAIDRCLLRDPALRFGSGEELVHALEELVPDAISVPEGNPYRGLHAFSAEHRALFFGRGGEIRAVLERLRADPLVVVSGDSGVGKSSLCRAGVLPLVGWGGLGEGRSYETRCLVPGRRPLFALLDALDPKGLDGRESRDEERLAQVRVRPEAPARALRGRLGDQLGLLLFVDRLEELLTQSDRDEAALFSEVLAHLCDHVPGVRLLLTARGDFLTRLAGLPGLGAALGRAVFVLRPLSTDDLREVVTGPARKKGVRFEREEMIDELVAGAQEAEGGLPLLEFALAELWEARDTKGQVIPQAALMAVGGVAGALARHADAVLSALRPEGRAAARRILLQLVTAEGTRARRDEGELVREETDRGALDALVRGRLLVAQEGQDGAAYELAHEALLRGWATLKGWLAADGGRQVARQRLASQAAEWERLGQAREALFGERQLKEVQQAELVAAELGPREAAFLRASTTDARRRRLLRRGVLLGVPVLLAMLYGASALRVRIEKDGRINTQMKLAQEELERARRLDERAQAERAMAFARFDEGDPVAGERGWEVARGEAAKVRGAYKAAGAALETALLVDNQRPAVRRRFAEVLFEHAGLLFRDHKKEQREDLLLRLVPYDDDGAFREQLVAPARVRLQIRPAATIEVRRYEAVGNRRRLSSVLLVAQAPGSLPELAPGSYLLSLAAPGRAKVRYAVLLAPGETHEAVFEMPREAAVPEGFVYVPPGRFLFGSDDDEGFRQTGLTAQPLHEARTPGFLIGRTEVTFSQWLDYLRDLPPGERERRQPRAGPAPAAIGLVEGPPGEFGLVFKRPGQPPQTVRKGERLRYAGRPQRAEQDWLRLPVTGISFEDAQAYAAWLARTMRLPGARLCDEREWERGARGADDRRYPHGDELQPDDANHDVTYGRHPLGFGPDEVGAHPGSESPFGLLDLAGNAWEWVRSVNRNEPIIYRGGGWYEGRMSSLSINRASGEATLRHITMGLRLCADVPPSR